MITLLFKATPAESDQKSDPRRGGRPYIETVDEKAPDPGFEGLWRSPNGSLYVFDGSSFVCVSVHSGRFSVWLNKVAVKNVRKAGALWIGTQAFRDLETGGVTDWVDITLEFQRDKVIKYFPTYIPRSILVHGYIEIYDRVLDR